MQNRIFWFSATGNSLYAAKTLAEAMGDTALSSMAAGSSPEPIGGKGCRVGFVFPSYYGDLPRLVRSFVESLEILPETELFSVVTMGAFGQGSVKALAELLEEKGLTLSFGIGVRMPANYILKYDPAIFGGKSPRRVEKRLSKVDARLRHMAAEIIAGEKKLKTFGFTARTMYEEIEALDADFFVTDACTGCGLCAAVCPVGNIGLTDEKNPAWLHRCEHCVACISWCPAVAIEYGEKTRGRTRYRNPRVAVTELQRREL